MTDDTMKMTTATPWHLWAVGVLALLWNGFGGYDFIMTTTQGATYMQAAGKKAGDVINIGFDTSPQIIDAFKNGWVQLTSDQQPFLQGYMPILSLCQQVVYGLGAVNVDTGAGFVTPDNYEAVAALAIEGLR